MKLKTQELTWRLLGAGDWVLGSGCWGGQIAIGDRSGPSALDAIGEKRGSDRIYRMSRILEGWEYGKRR
jgi:hypothetical protein